MNKLESDEFLIQVLFDILKNHYSDNETLELNHKFFNFLKDKNLDERKTFLTLLDSKLNSKS